MISVIGDEESARILEEYIATHDTVPALVEAAYERLRTNLTREKEHPETDWKANGLILWRACRDWARTMLCRQGIATPWRTGFTTMEFVRRLDFS